MSTRACALILIAVTLITFSPVVFNDFVRFDDPYTLHQNPRLNPPTLASVARYWREIDRGESGLYIPLTYTAWAGLAKIGRLEQADEHGIALNPWLFHAASLLVHTAAALIVFQLLRLLIDNTSAACAGALVFALHPLQVEPVAWASGLKDVLSGTLQLAALLVYLRRRRYALATALFVLAMLAKPSAVVLPLICFAIDVTVLRRPAQARAKAMLPWLLLAAPIAIVARRVQDAGLVTPPPLWARPVVASDAIAFYLGKLFWPMNLAIDYGRQPAVVLDRPITYVLALIPIALAVIIWRSRNRALAAAAIVSLLALLPVLGLTRFQFQKYSTVADHYMYVAMLGPALAAAWLLGRFPSRRATVIAAVILAGLAARTFAQTLHWRDDFTLFPHAVAVNPRSFLAHNNLGTALEATGRPREALPEYERAVALDPDYGEAHLHLARVSRQLGDRQRAAAAGVEALRVRTALPSAARGDLGWIIRNLADDLAAIGKTDDAVSYLSIHVKAHPEDVDAAQQLAALKARIPTTAP